MRKVILFFALILPIKLLGETITYKGINYSISQNKDTAIVTGRSCHSHKVVIPNYIRYKGIKISVFEIADGAFLNDDEIFQLKIGGNVQSIGYRAFYGCKNLDRIYFKYGLRHLSYEAFEGTRWIERQKPGIIYCAKVAYTYKRPEYMPFSISIRSGTKSIASGCFIPAKEIKKIKLPESLMEIGAEAFEDINIESIVVPEGVISIGDFAFSGCRHLKDVYIQGCKSIGMSAFYNCDSIQNVTLSKNLEEIGQFAFSNCINLQTIEVPAGVKMIHSCAFENCISLIEVRLNDGLEEIGDDAFRDCPLKSVSIPSTIKRIGITSFSNPCLLKTVTIYSEQPPLLIKNTYPNGVDKLYFSKLINKYWKCKEGRSLFVPEGSVDKYRNAEGWNIFNSISEISKH